MNTFSESDFKEKNKESIEERKRGFEGKKQGNTRKIEIL